MTDSAAKMALPSGWTQTATGVWRRETIHHMGRRCRNWDYCGKGVYMVTLTLNDRRIRVLGRLVGPPGEIELSPLGAAEINYRGMKPSSVESDVAETVKARLAP